MDRPAPALVVARRLSMLTTVSVIALSVRRPASKLRIRKRGAVGTSIRMVAAFAAIPFSQTEL